MSSCSKVNARQVEILRKPGGFDHKSRMRVNLVLNNSAKDLLQVVCYEISFYGTACGRFFLSSMTPSHRLSKDCMSFVQVMLATGECVQ